MLPAILRSGHRSVPEDGPVGLYLKLLKRTLRNDIYLDPEDMGLDRDLRNEGPIWRGDIAARWRHPMHTMAGMKRLDNVQFCMEDTLVHGVPGDFIETGVWRGGIPILMRAVLAAYGVRDRTVWLANSFRGLPAPDPDHYPNDRDLDLSQVPELQVSLEQVRANIARYGLLDAQVRFLEGWFKDTLPGAPIEQLAVLRLDGDLYQVHNPGTQAPVPQALTRWLLHCG